MSSDLVIDHGGSGSPITNSDRIVIGIAESITKPGLPYRCMIISANVIWEALGLTSTTTHANGFYTGVTLGLARMLHRFPVWSVCPDDESSQAAERD